MILRNLPGLLLTAFLVSTSVADKPNIVLCMADDQGWGDVGYYDHPVLKTPQLDDMAAIGLRFDRFYASAPVCSPTRASVLTGRTPNRMGCFKWGHTIRPQEVTIAEALKEAGYATGHFGKWHVGSVRRGSPVNPGASGFDHWLSAPNFFDNNPILSREGTAVELQGESSILTVEAAIEFIKDSAEEQKPFLAVVWFGSPHDPHRAADEDRALYQGHGKKADFYGEITGIDRAMGKLRATLRELNIADNTLLWYCSDNGGLPGLGVTGGRKAKGSVYEGGLRVPGIIEWPARVKQSRVTNFPANTYDIYPTLLEIVGVKIDGQPPLDGVSLLEVIDGKESERPRPMGFWDYPVGGIRVPSDAWMRELLAAQRKGDETGNEAHLRLDAGKIKEQYSREVFPGHSAWIEWPWKLHRLEDRGGEVKIELYDLSADPEEQKNLAADEVARSEQMQQALQTWLASVVDSLNGDDYP